MSSLDVCLPTSVLYLLSFQLSALSFQLFLCPPSSVFSRSDDYFCPAKPALCLFLTSVFCPLTSDLRPLSLFIPNHPYSSSKTEFKTQNSKFYYLVCVCPCVSACPVKFIAMRSEVYPVGSGNRTGAYLTGVANSQNCLDRGSGCWIKSCRVWNE